VCLRWRQLVNSPPLLQSVSLGFSAEQEPLRLRSFCEWMLLRASQHVQRLQISLAPHEGAKDSESAALLSAAVAACGAAGSLTELRLVMKAGNTPFICSSWLAALGSLRRLTIEVDGMLNVAASLQPLAALQELRLDALVRPFAARLPASLTLLHLNWFEGPALPAQVPLPYTECMHCCAASDA
jgi:hypothetical protein